MSTINTIFKSHPLITLLRLVIVVFCCARVPIANAATVKKVLAKKGLVTLDVTPDEKLEEGSELCIFNENDKKIDCGVITKIKGKTATLKLNSKKKIKKIKPDMSARLEDGESGDTPSGKESASKMPMGLLGRYVYTIAAPSSVSNPGYVVPSSTAPSTLWKDEGAVTGMMLGFSLAFSIPVAKYALIPGFRFRSAKAEVSSDYATDRRDPYVTTSTDIQNIGLFMDVLFLRSQIATKMFLNLGSGLDIDSSTVKFTAKKLDDSGTTPTSELASASSKLTVLSLRLNGGVDFMFTKSFGVSSGLNLLVPLTTFGAGFSGTVADTETKGVANPQVDLKTAINHKKSSFGAEFSIGPSLIF